MIQTEITYFTNNFMFTSESEKGVGDGHQKTFQLSVYTIAHLAVNMGLPSLGISQQPFFLSLSWFRCRSKGFYSLWGSVSSHALPCLSLCVTLNYLSLCLAHLNNHSHLAHCFFFLMVLDSCLLYGLLISNGLRAEKEVLIAANPLDKAGMFKQLWSSGSS